MKRFSLGAISSLATDGKTVSYKSGDETVQGVLYTPPGKGPCRADTTASWRLR